MKEKGKGRGRGGTEGEGMGRYGRPQILSELATGLHIHTYMSF